MIHPTAQDTNLFVGRTFKVTGWEGRTVRFVNPDGAALTCTYCYQMTSAERHQMARRAAAALNLVMHLTTDQIERCAPIKAPVEQQNDKLTGALELSLQIAVKTQPGQAGAN